MWKRRRDITYRYNDMSTGAFQDGRRTTTTYPTTTPVVMAYSYDNAGNAKKAEATAGVIVLTSHTYTYVQGLADRALRQSGVDNGVTTTYGYDDSNRLVAADASVGNDYTYTYDDNDNRVPRPPPALPPTTATSWPPTSCRA